MAPILRCGRGFHSVLGPGSRGRDGVLRGWGAVGWHPPYGSSAILEIVDGMLSKRKGPVHGPAPPDAILEGSFYSRLPNRLSSIMNMLMKSRYSRSAPMMADLPSHSLSPWWAWARYSFLMSCVS